FPLTSPLSFLPLPPTPGLSTLSLHDALPISGHGLPRRRPARAAVHRRDRDDLRTDRQGQVAAAPEDAVRGRGAGQDHQRPVRELDRKSTRLNSSHDQISYAVFCLKKKKKKQQ